MKLAFKFKFLALFIIVTLAMVGCATQTESPILAEPEQETAGTGIIAADSYPSGAEVYVDGELKGTTPATIYKIPSGKRIVTIRREGFGDFQQSVTVISGRTSEIQASLAELKSEEPKIDDIKAEEPAHVQTPPKLSSGNLNKTAVERKFTLYFDFDNGLVTDLRKSKTDVFFKNYKSYLYYTIIYPAKLAVADRTISEVTAEDCASANGVVAKVLSGQTLCVRTMEGGIAAIGGSWETEPEELEWVFFG